MIGICKFCGKEFDEKGAKKYCSEECVKKSRLQRLYPKIEKICAWCNKEFKPSKSDQKYCSFRCMYTARNDRKKDRYERKCVECGSEFITTRERKIYCSVSCKKRHIARERHDKERFSGNRESVVDRDSRKCTMCGSDYILSVHHKDHSGQTENRNDDPDNLTSLCARCHGKQHGRSINPEIHLTSKCLVCGKEFDTTINRIENGRGKYCSEECQKKRNSKTNIVTLNCEYCGKEFTVPLSRYKRGKVKYDSMECRRAAGYAWTNKQATN